MLRRRRGRPAVSKLILRMRNRRLRMQNRRLANLLTVREERYRRVGKALLRLQEMVTELQRVYWGPYT